MKIVRLFSSLFVLMLLAACASTPESKDYSYFHQSSPRSVVIVPVINHSPEVEAADLFLTTLAIPLAERGYYVFPTNMVKSLIEDDGLSDPHLVHSADTPQVAQLFGAESVLYVEVLDWRSRYAVISSDIIVHFLYTLKDGQSGDLLWQEQEEFTYSQSGNSGNIFVDLVATAITSAINNSRADYTPVAVAANTQALFIPGQGIPYGPYSPDIGKNDSEFPSSGTGIMSDATEVAVSLGFAAPTEATIKAQEDEVTDEMDGASSPEAGAQ